MPEMLFEMIEFVGREEILCHASTLSQRPGAAHIANDLLKAGYDDRLDMQKGPLEPRGGKSRVNGIKNPRTWLQRAARGPAGPSGEEALKNLKFVKAKLG